MIRPSWVLFVKLGPFQIIAHIRLVEMLTHKGPQTCY